MPRALVGQAGIGRNERSPLIDGCRVMVSIRSLKTHCLADYFSDFYSGIFFAITLYCARVTVSRHSRECTTPYRYSANSNRVRLVTNE